MNIYYVTKRGTCPVCHGERYVMNPFWEGSGSAEYNIFEYEIPCPECGGEGFVLAQVDLREALKDIGLL